ncbi:MAG: tetraacyldisaccharide 4'-kinase, partial [Acidobacteria bacterium]|nr:tetraacyldisaccharide 4'-kinase [Acidobacteriota bacterium]
AHLRKDGHELCYTRAFPDHHVFDESELDAVAREALSRGARAVLLTAKDAVKIQPRRFALPFLVVEIGLEFDDEGELLRLLKSAITRRAS